MKAKLLCTVCLLLSTGAIKAQGNVQFEGELHYRTMENHDMETVNLSFGMAYNGARNITYILKGDRVLSRDESTHMCTLYDPEHNTVTLYSDLIGKGMQFDFTTYAAIYMGAFSKEGPSYMGHGMPPTLYRFERKDTNIISMNRQAEYTIGRIENKTAATAFDIYSIPDINIPKTMKTAQLAGIEISGLVSKFKWEQINLIGNALKGTSKVVMGRVKKEASKIAGAEVNLEETKTYVCSELKDIKERAVSDDELTIPANIKIETFKSANGVFKVVDLYKENHSYLLSHKMYPTQVAQNVVYEINEDWDF